MSAIFFFTPILVGDFNRAFSIQEGVCPEVPKDAMMNSSKSFFFAFIESLFFAFIASFCWAKTNERFFNFRDLRSSLRSVGQKQMNGFYFRDQIHHFFEHYDYDDCWVSG